MLERRCPVVTGGYDDRNRVQLDWEEPRRAILEAPDTMDMEYVREYVDVGGP